MTDHAKCPKCGAEMRAESTAGRIGPDVVEIGKLVERVAQLEANDRDTCDRLLERVSSLEKGSSGLDGRSLRMAGAVDSLEQRVAELEQRLAVFENAPAPQEPPREDLGHTRRECWEPRDKDGVPWIPGYRATKEESDKVVADVSECIKLTQHRMVEVGEGDEIVPSEGSVAWSVMVADNHCLTEERDRLSEDNWRLRELCDESKPPWGSAEDLRKSLLSLLTKPEIPGTAGK